MVPNYEFPVEGRVFEETYSAITPQWSGDYSIDLYRSGRNLFPAITTPHLIIRPPLGGGKEHQELAGLMKKIWEKVGKEPRWNLTESVKERPEEMVYSRMVIHLRGEDRDATHLIGCGGYKITEEEKVRIRTPHILAGGQHKIEDLYREVYAGCIFAQMVFVEWDVKVGEKRPHEVQIITDREITEFSSLFSDPEFIETKEKHLYQKLVEDLSDILGQMYQGTIRGEEHISRPLFC